MLKNNNSAIILKSPLKRNGLQSKRVSSRDCVLFSSTPPNKLVHLKDNYNNMHSKLILIQSIFFLAILITQSYGVIKVFEDINFEGTSRILPPFKACLDLSHIWQDRISSIDTQGGCVILCEHLECRGKCEKIHPGTESHNDLRQFELNDNVSSFKQCETRSDNRVPE